MDYIKEIKDEIIEKKESKKDIIKDEEKLDTEKNIKEEVSDDLIINADKDVNLKYEDEVNKDNKNNKVKKKEEKLLEKEEKKNIDRKVKKQRSKLSKFIIIVTIFLFIFIFLILSFNLFIIFYFKTEKIINNTNVGQFSLAGLKKDEAIELITKKYDENDDIPVILKYKQMEFKIKPKDIGFKVKVNEAVSKAYNLGREANILDRNKQVFQSLFKINEIPLEFTYNEELFNKIINETYKKLPKEIKTKESSYKVDGDELIIYPGKKGLGINKEKLLESLNKTFISLSKDKVIDIPLLEFNPKEINLVEIKNKIYKEPIDATYNKSNGEITNEVAGIDFDLSLEEAEKIIKEKKEKYIIPLKITQPEITKTSLQEKYCSYNDLLGEHTSEYDTSDVDRSHNLVVASNAINGYILYPGKEFSFNSFVGRTTAEDGYRKTFGYAGGRKVPMWGGGVCQISSGIYVAALEADLEITERFNHGCPVTYMPPGLDSATDWGSCDLRFINNRDYPIKIFVNSSGGTSTAKIFGTKESGERKVVLESTKSNIVKHGYTFINDKKLKKGTEKVEVEGLDGFTARSYKKIYKGDQLVDTILISVDTYKPLNTVIRRNK